MLLAVGAAGGSVDHLYSMDDGLPKGSNPSTVALETIQEVAATIKRSGVWITPNLSCITGGRPLAPLEARARYLKKLHDAGVKLLLSKDDGFGAYDELTAFVDAGLTPYQALVTGTRNVAEYFGRLKDLGTVAVGKEADLVLLRNNPLADIRHTLEPAGVMIRGRWLDRLALDQHLLAFPASWLERIMRNRKGGIAPGGPGGNAGSAHRAKLASLIDSLELATANKAEYERLGRLFAAELGALRAIMGEREQLKWIDPPARTWMREQARRGYAITVPGVPTTP